MASSAAVILEDAFGRVREEVHAVLDDLPVSALAFRPQPPANPIAWLLWHLTRIQDDHVAAVRSTEQVWTAEGWDGRFGLALPAADTGYGHGTEQVDAVAAVESTEILAGYYDAVHRRTIEVVRGLSDEDLDRVVDDRFDPPVTLSVRLVSIIADDLQHAGQAAYIRGLAVS